MLPPRYILRENEIFNILKRYPSGTFLEIGFGDGDLLLALSRSGFYGCGYDFSETACSIARNKLRAQNINNIKLYSTFPDAEYFDYIFMFEVIGYISDPTSYLSKLSSQLNKKGKLLFSFTNKKHMSKAEEMTGEMKCFSKNEIIEILNNAGLQDILIWNYGYPLSNIIKPLTSLFYMFGNKNDKNKAIKNSGHKSKNIIASITYILLNRYTLYPFSCIQRLFRESNLGTGYIVVATIKD